LLEQSIPAELDEVRDKLAEIRTQTERTIVEIRRLIAALSPAILEQLGLAAALRQMVNRFRQVYSAKVRLQIGKLPELSKRVEAIMYRLVQECLNNIAKHSQARAVNISISAADGKLKLDVSDNGVGFQLDDAMKKQNSFGLAGMRERVALLGGRFELVSQPAAPGPKRKSGTKISIELPAPGAPKCRGEFKSASNGRSESRSASFLQAAAERQRTEFNGMVVVGG
jgi:two-component system sensor histidine kinase DegS